MRYWDAEAGYWRNECEPPPTRRRRPWDDPLAPAFGVANALLLSAVIVLSVVMVVIEIRR